jgi:pimeloyl-ACP methyl ester carboxylesterase
MWNKEFVKDNPATIERFIATYCEYPTPALARLSQGNVFKNVRTYDRLPDIKAPTLVITGAEDRLMPYENSKLLAARIPNAELAIIENAGHGLFISDPTEKASKIVLDFLRRHSKARANN